MKRLQRTLLFAAIVGLAGIGGSLYLALEAPKQAERLRDKIARERLFSFGRLSVRAMTVVREGREIRLERDPSSSWRIDAPVRWPADLQAVEALMDRTAGLRAEGTAFEDPTREQLANTGLLEPRLRLEVELGDGTRHELAIGTENPLTELLHVRADGGPIVVVDAEYQWTLDRPLDELRADRLFPYRSDDVAEIRVRPPSGAGFRLVRSGAEAYEVEADEQRFRAGVGVAAVFVAAVTKRLEAENYLGDTFPYPEIPATIESFESGSGFSLAVEHASGEVRTASIALARREFENDQVPIAWIDESVVELYPPPVDEILQTRAEDLRDRNLARFDPDAAARLRIEYGGDGRPWVFEQSASDGTWRRVEPRPAEAESRLLDTLVLRLARLKGDRTITESPSRAELRRWLLDPASRHFVVEDASGRELADVRLGDWASDEELYVKGDGPRVDAISIDSVLSVPVDLKKLVQSE